MYGRPIEIMKKPQQPEPTLKKPNIAEDHVVPFQAEGLDVRGRVVHLGPALNSILNAHQYPEPVSGLLAEAIVLGTLLGTSLTFDKKYGGRFTIQTQCDGPVSFLVVDFRAPNAIRAYASYDEALLGQYIKEEKRDTPSLLGKGVLAMTIDQGNNARYQGVVALDGLSFEDIAHQYFRQSEQIPTKVRLAAARLIEPDGDGGNNVTWRAGGLIAQFLPDAPERMKKKDLPDGRKNGETETDVSLDDSWVEASSLVGTISDDELCDPQLASEDLLFRLFHERGVRVYPATHVVHQCSCSKEKVARVVNALSPDERKDALAASETDGAIVSKCEYCATRYEIDMQELDQGSTRNK